jgi:glutamate/tyrosine decarboxylase-like PLP-dependent enzyme
VAAHWLATAWDQNAYNGVTSPAAAAFDALALRWLAEALGLPADTGGALVTGATMANVCGIAAGRQAVLSEVGWDVTANGVSDAPPFTVFVGEACHPTVLKALGILGHGRARVHRLPVDDQGRIVARELPAIDGPAVVCAQAGQVNTGASDPFDALRDWCDGAGAWLHVDGAFGLWAAASPRYRTRVAGIERADSWAGDGHKWLNVPYDCGFALTRRPQALSAVMRMEAPYLATHGFAPGDYAPESSRRARGVDVVAALAALGRDGVVALVDRCCALAAACADGLRGLGLEIRNDVVLNQVVVGVGDEARTRAVLEALVRDGTCWCGPTMWRGQPAIRVSVSGWSTAPIDIERTVAAFARACEVTP